MNYIYLVQTTGSVGREESIYKIGKSTKKDFERFKGYEKGFRLLFQMACDDCHSTETFLIKEFKSKFIHRKDRGTEHFEGDYRIMMDIIYNYIRKENSNHASIDVSSNGDMLDSDVENSLREIPISEYIPYIRNKINALTAVEFPDITPAEHYVKIISDELVFYLGEPSDDKINHICNEINNSIVQTDSNWLTDEEWKIFIDEYKIDPFIRKKLGENIPSDLIESHCKIEEFIKLVKKTKRRITLEFYQEFLLYHKINPNNTDEYIEKICELVLSGVIINNSIYMQNGEQLKVWKEFKSNSYLYNDIPITIYKINGKYYDSSYFERYMPYMIRWNSDKDYYVVNKNMEYIDVNGMSGIKYINYKQGGEQCIWDADTIPWESKENYINMCMSYWEIVKYRKLNKCLNSSYLDQILKMFPLPPDKNGPWQSSIDYFASFLIQAIKKRGKDAIPKKYAYYAKLGEDSDYKVNPVLLYSAYEQYCSENDLYVHRSSKFVKMCNHISYEGNSTCPDLYILHC